MSLAPRTSRAASFVGPASTDLRQPLLSHLREAIAGEMSEADAAALLAELNRPAVRNNPEAMQNAIDAALGEGGGQTLARIMGRVLRYGQNGTEIGWLPLEAMLSIKGGKVVGFKGPEVLNTRFKRWEAKKVAAGANADDLSPEDFIYEMRLDQALEFDADGVAIGFRNAPDAMEGYRNWVLRQVRKRAGSRRRAKSALGPNDYARFPADEYLQKMRPGGKPAAAVEGLFGPSPARRPVQRQISGAGGSGFNHWAKRFGRAAPKPEPDWQAKVVALVTDPAEFNRRMRERYPDGIPTPWQEGNLAWDDRIGIWLNDALIHKVFEVSPDAAPDQSVVFSYWLRQHIMNTNDAGMPLDTLSAEGTKVLTALMGPKAMKEGVHSEEFLDRLIDSYVSFGAVANRLNVPWDSGAYRRHGGMFELVQKCMSRSGTPRGYVFELETIFVAIQRYGPDADMYFQFKIAKKDGPDMMLVDGNTVRVFQAKAHINVADVYGWTGVAAKQTGSDISRMLDEFGPDFAELTPEQFETLLNTMGALDIPVKLDDTTTKRLHSEWTYSVDGRRPGHTVTGAQIANMRTATEEMNAMFLRNATDDDVLSQADVFNDFCNRATHRLSTDGATVGETLQRASRLQTAPPLTLAEAAILRLFLQGAKGELTDGALTVLIRKARLAGKFDPPLKILLDLRTKDHLDNAGFATAAEGLIGAAGGGG